MEWFSMDGMGPRWIIPSVSSLGSATNGDHHPWMVGISMDGALTIAGSNNPTYPSSSLILN